MKFTTRNVLLLAFLSGLFLFKPAVTEADNQAHAIWAVGFQVGLAEMGADQNVSPSFLVRLLTSARNFADSTGCIPTDELDELIRVVGSASQGRDVRQSIINYRNRLGSIIFESSGNNCDCSGSRADSSNSPEMIGPGRYYKIVNRNSGKVLDIAGARKDNGGMAMQWQNSDSPSALWQVIPAGNGYYKIINQNSGKTLAVSMSSKSNGGNAIQWEDKGQADIFWRFIPADNGYYKIENRNSGLVLAISRGTRENGAYAIQWEDKGQSDIYWRIDPQ